MDNRLFFCCESVYFFKKNTRNHNDLFHIISKQLLYVFIYSNILYIQNFIYYTALQLMFL
jgi:hypothetical protein